jgi:hypothetical protein
VPPQKGEPTDQPRDGQRALAGHGDEDHAERDAQHAGHREHPVVAEHLAEAIRVSEFEQAGEQRPERDEIEQRQRRDARPEERDQPGERAGDPVHDQWPLPTARTKLTVRDSRQREQTFAESESAEQHDQGGERHTGPHEGGNAEQRGDDTAQRVAAPIPGDDNDHHWSPC